MSTFELTELEGATLGLLSLHAPATPYQVRKLFIRSPSSYWSGSAGAIYPLFRRLERNKLISARQEGGGRRARHYVVTRSGMAALRTWIANVDRADVLGIPMDPVRTRARFLETLTLQQRNGFVRKAAAALKVQLSVITRQYKERSKSGDLFGALTSRGSQLMTQARIAWLREVERATRSGKP